MKRRVLETGAEKINIDRKRSTGETMREEGGDRRKTKEEKK